MSEPWLCACRHAPELHGKRGGRCAGGKHGECECTVIPDPEKPLHVRTAEALGWRDIRPCSCGIRLTGVRPHDGSIVHVPPFGEDSPEGWAATGPLLTRNSGITVETPLGCTGGATATWVGYDDNPADPHRDSVLGSFGIERRITSTGWSAPEAIAKLFIELAKVGRVYIPQPAGGLGA